MMFALDLRIPRVWRSPDSLQFGVDEPMLVLDGVSAAQERMLAAAADGVTEEGLRVVAQRALADDGEAQSLIERIAPVLLAGRRRHPPPPLVVLLDGSGETVDVLSRMLSATDEVPVEAVAGPPWPEDAIDRADAVVIVASYAVDPHRHARWLRRDVPHLPIVYSDGGVTVGPYVRPGEGPCLRCIDLHRTDADSAWPAMATQLHTREPPGETAIAASAAAARAAAVVLAACRGGAPSASASASASPSAPTSTVGVSARLATGAVDWVSRGWEPHPECGCLGLPP